jgi:hypothetical protein
MSETTALLLLVVLPSLIGIFVVWKLLQMGRRAQRVFRSQMMAPGEKRFWLVLLAVGGFVALAGAVMAGQQVTVGWHIGGLGLAWFLTAIWIPAYHDRELMNDVRDWAYGACLIGSLMMLAGIGFVLFGSPEPVFGSASLGDLLSYFGFGAHLVGLWTMAPGPGGISVG